MKPVALMLTALLLLAAGCPNEKADALRAEIAKLKEERVEVATIEQAKQQAADAEAALATTLTALEAANVQLGDRTEQRDRTRAAIEAEAARNARLRGEIEAVVQDAQQRAALGQQLDAKIAVVRERATWVRDQAAVLARELRPADPAWASARRLDSFAEFSGRVASEYPDDPVAAAVSQQAVRADAPSADQVRIASEQAARLRDRFASVYELPSRDVARSEARADDAPAADAPVETAP